jgi:Spy/CpxP family protein refolding chaperone
MLYQMTRRRVGLTEAQMNQLVPINQSFESERRAIQRQERVTRLALREALRDSSAADQPRIAGYLDKLVELQRQRVELVAKEQRDLAGFMTPLQRARYTALQEQVRRRIEQMQRQNRLAGDTALGGARNP